MMLDLPPKLSIGCPKKSSPIIIVLSPIENGQDFFGIQYSTNQT